MLSSRQLQVFAAVMRSGSVTAAARALHSSQPTLSRELARLEQVLGFALFDRAGGRLHPTARGLALYEEVDRVHQGLAQVQARAERLARFAEGQLTVACLPALAHALLPPACARFAGQHPDVALSIVPLESPQLEEALTAQRHDLGLVEHSQAPPGTRLHTLLATAEVCVLPAGHALSARPVLTPADFAGQRFVSLAPGDAYRSQVDDVFRTAQVERRLVLETRSAVSVCSLVAAGLGLGIVNPLTALALADPRLAVRRFSVAIPFEVGLVLPLHRPSTPLVDHFVEALGQAAQALMEALPATV